MTAGPLQNPVTKGTQRSSKRTRTSKGCLVALGGLLLLVAILAVVSYRAAHPSDIVVVEVHSLPHDLTYVCIAYLDDGQARLLDEYRQELLPFDHYIRCTPDGGDGDLTPIRCPRAGVAWRSSARYVVLWRDRRARWFQRSIDSARVVSAPVDSRSDWARERKIIQFQADDRIEVVSPSLLVSLGIHENRVAGGGFFDPPGIRCIQEFEGRVDEAYDLIETMRFHVMTKHVEEAESIARQLAQGLPKVTSHIQAPTPPQLAAASELKTEFASFRMSQEDWPVFKLEKLDRWVALLKILDDEAR